MELIIRSIKTIKVRSREEVQINIGVNELIRELSEKMAKVNEIKGDLVKSHKYGQASEVREIEILFDTTIDKLKKFLKGKKIPNKWCHQFLNFA